MADLLPCPFCGGEAVVQSSWSKGGGFSVTCQTGHCMGVNWEQDEQGGFAAEFPTDAEAIAAWNRRALPAVTPTVEVKPLVWEQSAGGVWIAQTGLGSNYSVADSQWFYGPMMAWVWIEGGDDAAKAAAQADYEARILSALDLPPAPVTTEIALKLDTTMIQAAIDKAMADVGHLNTIAATIRVNCLRHGGTHEQADAFVRGEADFVAWMVERLKPAPTLAEALELPEVKALVKALDALARSSDCVDACPCFRKARNKARALLAQIKPALVVEQNKSLTDGIREAIRLAEQPHYGDTVTALDHYGEAVEVLRSLLKKQSG